MPSAEQSCGSESGANATRNTIFVDSKAAINRCLTDHQGLGQENYPVEREHREAGEQLRLQ